MAVQAKGLQAVAPSGFDGILKEDVRFSTGNKDGVGDAVNGWFDRLMLQSGIKTPPAVWLLLCLLVGATIGGSLFVVTENVLMTAFGFFIGLAVPIAVATFQRSKRQKQIMEQMPGMAEALARAARTGRNVVHSSARWPLTHPHRLVMNCGLWCDERNWEWTLDPLFAI